MDLTKIGLALPYPSRLKLRESKLAGFFRFFPAVFECRVVLQSHLQVRLVNVVNTTPQEEEEQLIGPMDSLLAEERGALTTRTLPPRAAQLRSAEEVYANTVANYLTTESWMVLYYYHYYSTKF